MNLLEISVERQLRRRLCRSDEGEIKFLFMRKIEKRREKVMKLKTGGHLKH